jgi:acyl-CoA synthetase (AMP-forming)/AMP-acid ligase II
VALSPLPAGFRPLTIDAGIRAAANRTPGKMALREGARHLSYAALVERTDRVAAAAVADLRLEPGATAALLTHNCLEFIEIIAGLAGAGIAVATPSPRLSMPEIGYILQDCGARAVFVAPALAEAVRDLVAPGTRVIEIGPEYEAWLARSQARRPEVAVAEWDTFSIPYTSGTTGKPKGVMLPHRSRTLTYFAMGIEYGCYGPDDRAVAMAPMCHGAGLAFAFAPVFFGGFCEILPRFEPEALLQSLHDVAATNLFVVPTHLHALFALDPAILARWRRRHRLRAIICNAAPLPQATRMTALDYFGDGLLHETYGSTEAGIVTNLRPVDQRRKVSCVGLPFPGTEVELRGADGAPVAVGSVGELFSRSPFLFNGYWGKPEESAEALAPGQWVTAGDLARQDEEGFVYIVDRKKDMVISGGINIYPREIEEVLFAHPAVADAAVVGVPDAYWGEALKAYVVRRPGVSLEPEELLAHCRAGLAGYKVPHAYDFVPELPRNPAGKVVKSILRDRG